MNKIKVGIIRCDLHAVYYANIIQKHDPYILRKREYGGGGYFYFYTDYRDPAKMIIPTLPGFEITKLWDEDAQRVERMWEIYYGKPQICQRFEDVSDDVDLVLIADCNGDGSDHLKLASPGIKKGIPTFIDKPFAYDVEDARELVALAKKHRTPIMSISLLGILPHVDYFKREFGRIAPLHMGIVNGTGPTMAGHIHGIALAQHLFGRGVEWVEAVGDTPLELVHLYYPDFWVDILPSTELKCLGFDSMKEAKKKKGLKVIISNAGLGPHCSFYSSVYGRRGVLHSPAFSDWEFPYAVVEVWKKIKKMVKTRQPQIPYEEMVECIAIASAARLSQKERRRVFLKEV